jgi:hypothetical protein
MTNFREYARAPGLPKVWQLLLAWLLSGWLIAQRKPSVVLRADFYGDDGWSWYPDAYHSGWHCLLMPAGGYLNTLQRLVGLAVQPFPLFWAPTLFALTGIAVQALPAVFLLSTRMAKVWPGLPARALFALIVLALPDEIEWYANLTNAQWSLALLAFLVLVSDAPRSRIAGAFDAAVLLLSGLSGPFCVFLAPVAAWQVWERRDGAAAWRLAPIALTSALQIAVFLASPLGSRTVAPLGAEPGLLARILAQQVFLAPELGLDGIQHIPQLGAWQSGLIPWPVAASCLALTTIALWRGNNLLRNAVMFAALLLTAALLSPQASLTRPQWELLTEPPTGNRYFTFTVLAWIGVLFVLAADRNRGLRALGGGLVAAIMLWGIPHDWQLPRWPWPHADYAALGRELAAARARKSSCRWFRPRCGRAC